MEWLNMWELMNKKEENENIKIGSQEGITKYNKPVIKMFIKYLDTNKCKTITVLNCKNHFRALVSGHEDVCGKTEKETAEALEKLI
ncbi:hypothetical protein [Limosilactobacillus reuteri]|uniref:hypothetical protein n=1 Tax=Limosilactobacillus reuteri TaxID=1598 RepID=UPI001E46876F|nr:hypothetical protein [Limosilactobacillus reuteri]MCC4459599.1 hypothetical protein [Limosilactobacillus reuteri]MCC4461568.1 hypothetical protein [Limosilactobacillus reuteri]